MKKKFDYKWVIIGLSFLMVFTVLGFCSSSKSLYISAICDAMGISRSAFSINDSCRYITTSIVNIFFGTLIARFGAKKLILAGFCSLIVSSLIYSLATNIYMFYVGGVFLGVGLSWTTTTMVGSVINKWCKENRGTIMGFVLASNGLGAALAMQIVSPIIYNPNNPFGYQNAYRLVALILAVVAIIVFVFFRENPKDKPEAKVVRENKKGRGQSWQGIPYSDALKKKYFYAASICIFLAGMVLQGVSGVAAPHLKDLGLDPAYVATVLSLHAISLSLCKFLTGFIYDRTGLRITTNMCLFAAFVAMALLAMATNSPTGKMIAMLYGVISALALPLETIMLPIFASDLFGEHSFNKVLGIFASVNTAGYALGAPIVNLCYDILGSYNVAFYGACVLVVLIAIIMQFVISAANRERRKIAEI